MRTTTVSRTPTRVIRETAILPFIFPCKQGPIIPYQLQETLQNLSQEEFIHKQRVNTTKRVIFNPRKQYTNSSHNARQDWASCVHEESDWVRVSEPYHRAINNTHATIRRLEKLRNTRLISHTTNKGAVQLDGHGMKFCICISAPDQEQSYRQSLFMESCNREVPIIRRE